MGIGDPVAEAGAGAVAPAVHLAELVDGAGVPVAVAHLAYPLERRRAGDVEHRHRRGRARKHRVAELPALTRAPAGQAGIAPDAAGEVGTIVTDGHQVVDACSAVVAQ